MAKEETTAATEVVTVEDADQVKLDLSHALVKTVYVVVNGRRSYSCSVS